MREDIKFIVTEVNKLLGRNYNVICFNALSPEELLQVLREVIIKIQDQNDTNTETGNESLEQISIYILSVLRILNYQPQTNPATFRQGLIKGDPETIHPILTWLLTHVDVVRKRAYLARFLVKVEVPNEYLGDPEVSALHEQYTALVEHFKTAHKEREIGKKNLESTSELIADLQTMEKEKEALQVRIEKMKAKAQPGAHLLEAARSLRIEKDRDRDLALQDEQETETVNKLQNAIQRVEREVQMLRKDDSENTVEALLKNMSEIITVQTVVAKEKLPTEINAKRNRIKALNAVKKDSYLGPDSITALRNKLDNIAKEIQELVERKISNTNVDKIEPFRQQAAAVANMKRNVIERLQKAESTLQELQSKLEEKRELSKIGDEIAPKGEDLKKYISRLKTRSTLYKHCKAELAGLTAENSVLQRTVGILENQLSRCNETKKLLEPIETDIPDSFTEETASKIVAELSKKIMDDKEELTPLLNEIQSLRQKLMDVEDRYQTANKNHNAIESDINKSIENLTLEVEELKQELEKDTREKERVEGLIKKMKATEERINQESQDYPLSETGKNLEFELTSAIKSEEANLKRLMAEKDKVSQNVLANEKQTQMWESIASIFKSKLQCAEESKQQDGIVLTRGGAETLVLQ